MTSSATTGFSAVPPRPKIYTAIVEQILEGIRNGIFPPGEMLPSERSLASQLGVSRASLREAVRVLEHAGVLDVRSGTGTFISADSMSKASVLRARSASVGEHSPLDLIVVRLHVEPLGAELAASHHNTRDLQVIASTLEQHDRVLLEGSDPSEPDLAFHLAVSAASHNQVLLDTQERFVELMHEGTWSRMKGESRSRESASRAFLNEHIDIYEYIRKRDGKRASKLMTMHLENVRDALHKVEVE